MFQNKSINLSFFSRILSIAIGVRFVCPISVASALTYNARNATNPELTSNLVTNQSDRKFSDNSWLAATDAISPETEKNNSSLTSSSVENNSNAAKSRLKLVRLISLSFFLLLFVPLGIFYPLFLFYRKLLGSDRESNAFLEGDSRAKLSKTIDTAEILKTKEKNISLATVSKLQIAFSPQASSLRSKLELVASNIDRNSKRDLVELMRQAVLVSIAQRHWTHVSYSSDTLPLEENRAKFNETSRIERNKCLSKTLSLINSDRQKQDYHSLYKNDAYSYVVVTLIFSTFPRSPLCDKIYTEKQLAQELLELSKMRQDYLIEFELLWNPQQEGEYITNEQLLTEYGDLTRLL